MLTLSCLAENSVLEEVWVERFAEYWNWLNHACGEGWGSRPEFETQLLVNRVEMSVPKQGIQMGKGLEV